MPFNPRSLSSQTLATYEIMGGYIVNIFYSHLYDKARQYHSNGTYSSVTDAYKSICHTYLQQFKNPELYKQTIMDLHGYYSAFNTYNLSYKDWINNVVREFVPADFFPSLNDRQKDHILGVTLENCVKEFATHMLQGRSLMMIIDDHASTENIRIFQDKMLEITAEQRELVYQRFLKGISGRGTDERYEKMAGDIKHYIAENNNLRDKLKRAVEIIKTQKQDIKVADEKNEYLLNRARELYAKLETMQEQAQEPAQEHDYVYPSPSVVERAPTSTKPKRAVRVQTPHPTRSPEKKRAKVEDDSVQDTNTETTTDSDTSDSAQNEYSTYFERADDSTTVPAVSTTVVVEDANSDSDSAVGDSDSDIDIKDIRKQAAAKIQRIKSSAKVKGGTQNPDMYS